MLSNDEKFRRGAAMKYAHDAERIATLEDQVKELRQSLIGGIEGVKAGHDLTKWAEANERLLARQRR